MARFAKDTKIVSPPVRVFPNGDHFFIEMERTNSHYECILKMAPGGKEERSFTVVEVSGKTMREAQEKCYRKGIEKCPRLPSPPWVKRGEYTFLAPVAKPTPLTKPTKKS